MAQDNQEQGLQHTDQKGPAPVGQEQSQVDPNHVVLQIDDVTQKIMFHLGGNDG